MVFFGDNTNGVGITKSVSHPSPLDAGALGISHAARAFSLPARRGGPCKQFEAHGLTAYGLFPHKSLQEQAPVRACTKKAQRFALSFKLFAEREAPAQFYYNFL